MRSVGCASQIVLCYHPGPPTPLTLSGSWGVETGAGVEKNVEEKERIHSYLALLFFFNPLLGFPLGATGVVDPAVRMSD